MKIKRYKSDYVRRDLETYYSNKYYCLFLNRYKWSGEIERQQIEFIMRQFWSVGTIACFKLKGTEGSTKHPQGLLVFTPYAVNGWNLYDYPIEVNLINLKGVKFIPAKAQKVDVDVVLGWVARNHKGLSEFVRMKIEQIVDVEMVIRTNLKAHKMPYLIPIEPENETKMLNLWRSLELDEDKLFIDLTDADKIKILNTGAQFIIDKLYNYKATLENELREYLGLDNLGVNEKKEHLISNEIEANDEITESATNSYLDCLKEFTNKIQEVFGIVVEVELNTQEDKIEVEAPQEEERENEDL